MHAGTPQAALCQLSHHTAIAAVEQERIDPCRAGLGRTGTIAALLLVEDGASAADAVARIRREHDAAAVETEAQARFLAERAPDVILQGYLYGKPAPAEDWLARWQADGALPALPCRDATAAALPLTACA